MKAVLVALLALGLVTPLAPVASAHHVGCDPDYPCTPVPCDAKCWTVHFVWVAKCAIDPHC